MEFHKAWLWVAIGGVIALVFVSVVVPDPGLRALLSVLVILPLLKVTLRVTLGSARQAADDRRKYMKLRSATDEFIMYVRNLNRLSVIARAEDAPDNAPEMIEDVVQRMHSLVERMRGLAGEESMPLPGEMD